jgi:hypothetical protein
VRLLEKHSDYGGYDEDENITFESAEENLKTFYGRQDLLAFDDKDQKVPTHFTGLIQKGYPSEVLDGVEAWFEVQPSRATECEMSLNQLFSMNNLRWRIANGEAILVDSDYAHEMQSNVVRLLRDAEAGGALEEFHGAIRDYQVGETKDAVVKAHKSVESVMKTVLGSSGHITYGKLLENLIRSEFIPTFYEEFFVHFEKLALGATKQRNQPGTGHGQGMVALAVPRPLAEFAINLAASINLFLLRIRLEQRLDHPENPESDADIPF